MKQPSTSSSPRRAERWPASIEIPKKATAIDIIMVATDELMDVAIQSAAEEITDIDHRRNASRRSAWSNYQRPRTVSDPPVMFPAVE